MIRNCLGKTTQVFWFPGYCPDYLLLSQNPFCNSLAAARALFMRRGAQKELRQCPHLHCQLLRTGLLGSIAWDPTCLQPTDTTTAQIFNPVIQVGARQVGFPVVLRFLENAFIFTALWFCQQTNTGHETVFPVSFFSQRKGEKKALSQQTYLLGGTKEKFQNGGQNCS